MLKIFSSPLKKLAWTRDDYVLEILLVSILIVPFTSIVDVLWFFTSESFQEWDVIHTPVVLKILKDVFLMALFAALLFQKKTYSRWSKLSIGFLFSVLAFAISNAFIKKIPMIVILSGLRWYIPLFLFPLFDQFQAKREHLVSLYERYRLILIAAIPLEIAQILFSTRWNVSQTDPTYMTPMYSRANGFFSQPQPMSLFALFFLIIVFEIVPEKKKRFNYLLTLISIALTKSAAGILGISSLFFTKANKKYKALTVIVIGIVMAIFPLLTGRTDYWKSPLKRFEVLTEVNLNHIVFGSYSNACNTIQRVNPTMTLCVIPDSYLTSSIGNLGLAIGIMLLLFLLGTIYRSKKYYLFPIFVLFLLSANLTEYFPLNILFPFVIGLKMNADMAAKYD